jgi:dipeptidyl aminopeptidase/acylaminoacyl peptidase
MLKRCFQKDVRQRLRDIGEARITLGAAMDAEDEPATRSRVRGISWWTATPAVLVVAILAVFATLRFGQGSASGPLRKLDLVAKDVVVDWPIAPQLSPDGSRFAYASANRVWVRDLDRLEPRAVADISAASPVSWSPDSRELVFSDNRKLWKVAVEGGRATAICEIPRTGSIIAAAWSSSGKIAFSVWRDQIYEVPANGGTPAVMVALDPLTEIDFHALSWLRNGELLFVTHWKSTRDSTGHVVPALTFFDGKKLTRVPGDFGSPDDAPLLTATGQLLYLTRGATPGIWAVPFDLEQHQAAEAPVLVAPDAVTLSASADGSLLYSEGLKVSVQRELVWRNRSGEDLGAVGSPHRNLGQPRLSPDGSRVAFSAADGDNEDVWVLDLKTGTETRLTFGPQVESSPEWMASSLRLSYVEDNGMQARVFSINADGSGEQREFAPLMYFGMQSGGVTMAPDGRSSISEGTEACRSDRCCPAASSVP